MHGRFFLDNVDVDVRDRFVEVVGESRFSVLKPMIIDGSYIELYQFSSSILAANNNGEDIRLKLESLGSKYKSESGELFNNNKKATIIYHLKRKLFT